MKRNPVKEGESGLSSAAEGGIYAVVGVVLLFTAAAVTAVIYCRKHRKSTQAGLNGIISLHSYNEENGVTHSTPLSECVLTDDC
ncbi:hypothetical protein G5714_021223 [Onychostoma macrolepis]|uniref:Uncharacterized protein n=2 Tax=Onychostoma macrolepis TaxID=369639 RepID=A0A7J6BSF1_9TELE|nr:hypothetical protein G5714_021223 [Onychostoma macrolepis]